MYITIWLIFRVYLIIDIRVIMNFTKTYFHPKLYVDYLGFSSYICEFIFFLKYDKWILFCVKTQTRPIRGYSTLADGCGPPDLVTTI